MLPEVPTETPRVELDYTKTFKGLDVAAGTGADRIPNSFFKVLATHTYSGNDAKHVMSRINRLFNALQNGDFRARAAWLERAWATGNCFAPYKDPEDDRCPRAIARARQPRPRTSERRRTAYAQR